MTASTNTSVQTTGTPFEVDPELMRRKFGRESFEVRHNLSDHPLLTIERLAQLADSLPADQAEFV